MPITKSAKKSIKQSLRRKKMNVKKKNTIRNLTKEIKSFVSKNKIEEAKKLLPQIYKAIDKAVKVGILKKNTAARKKSQIATSITKDRK